MVSYLIKILPWAFRLSSTGTLAFTGKGGLIIGSIGILLLYVGFKYGEHRWEEHRRDTLQARQVETIIGASEREDKNEQKRIKEVQSARDDLESGNIDSVYDYINGVSNY